MPLPYQLAPLSETAILLLFDDRLDTAISAQVTGLHRHWLQHPFDGLVETVPGYHSLAIFTDAWRLHQQGVSVMDTVRQQVIQALEAISESKAAASAPLKTIPVRYGGADIMAVAQRNGLTVDEVVALHTAVTYRVFMMGFQPGFAYLGITDERLFTERKEKPMPVTAGSVALAGRQTGVYPQDSPGGWQVIGHTEQPMFDPSHHNPFFLQAGDEVRFITI